MERTTEVEARLRGLVTEFAACARRYDDLVPFSTRQAEAHRATIAALRSAGSVAAALDDHLFVASLYRTLKAWRLGCRGSNLVPLDDFAEALQSAKLAIAELEPFHIDSPDLPADIADGLWQVMDGLGVVMNKAKLVAGTKTLHHLLPELVVPMDRQWTGQFFNIQRWEWQSDQYRMFRRVYDQLAAVARQTAPQFHVTGAGWRTSRTKVLDNAIIGYCKRDATPMLRLPEVTFVVDGLPPAKDGAESMLAAKHRHATRVKTLLRATKKAADAQAFPAVATGSVLLELVVRTTPGARLCDATNSLGGVGDVLENKAHRQGLEYLGDLGAVHLYENDRQIKQVSYREVVDRECGYTVTVRRLT